MNDGYGAAGTARPELLAKMSRIARRNRSVIQTAGIDCDLIPTMQRVEPSTRRDYRNNRRRSALKTRPQFLVEAIVRPSGKDQRRKSEREKEQRGYSCFHIFRKAFGATVIVTFSAKRIAPFYIETGPKGNTNVGFCGGLYAKRTADLPLSAKV